MNPLTSWRDLSISFIVETLITALNAERDFPLSYRRPGISSGFTEGLAWPGVVIARASKTDMAQINQPRAEFSLLSGLLIGILMDVFLSNHFKVCKSDYLSQTPMMNGLANALLDIHSVEYIQKIGKQPENE